MRHMFTYFEGKGKRGRWKKVSFSERFWQVADRLFGVFLSKQKSFCLALNKKGGGMILSVKNVTIAFTGKERGCCQKTFFRFQTLSWWELQKPALETELPSLKLIKCISIQGGKNKASAHNSFWEIAQVQFSPNLLL